MLYLLQFSFVREQSSPFWIQLSHWIKENDDDNENKNENSPLTTNERSDGPFDVTVTVNTRIKNPDTPHHCQCNFGDKKEEADINIRRYR